MATTFSARILSDDRKAYLVVRGLVDESGKAFKVECNVLMVKGMRRWPVVASLFDAPADCKVGDRLIADGGTKRETGSG